MKIKNNLKNKYLCKIICEINKWCFFMASCLGKNNNENQSEKDPIHISSEKQIIKNF